MPTTTGPVRAYVPVKLPVVLEVVVNAVADPKVTVTDVLAGILPVIMAVTPDGPVAGVTVT